MKFVAEIRSCGFTCVRLGSHNANEHLLRLNTSWSSGEESNQYHGQDLLAEKSLSVTLNDVNSRSEGQASSQLGNLMKSNKITAEEQDIT